MIVFDKTGEEICLKFKITGWILSKFYEKLTENNKMLNRMENITHFQKENLLSWKI